MAFEAPRKPRRNVTRKEIAKLFSTCSRSLMSHIRTASSIPVLLRTCATVLWCSMMQKRYRSGSINVANYALASVVATGNARIKAATEDNV